VGNAADPADVYLLDLDSLTWTRHAPTPGNTEVPAAHGSNGTYGRFRYCPSRNVFVGINDVFANVYIYRLTDEGDTMPPAAPANLGVT
jgi:hypothetical protein